MAVAHVVTWKVRPDRLGDFVAKAGHAKKIHERLGARVMVVQNAVGGEPGVVDYVTSFEDLTAWTQFANALQADTEWAEFWMSVLSDPNPTATNIGSRLVTEIPGI